MAKRLGEKSQIKIRGDYLQINIENPTTILKEFGYEIWGLKTA